MNEAKVRAHDAVWALVRSGMHPATVAVIAEKLWRMEAGQATCKNGHAGYFGGDCAACLAERRERERVERRRVELVARLEACDGRDRRRGVA